MERMCVWLTESLWELRLWIATILLKWAGNQNIPTRLSEYYFPHCFVCCKSIDSTRAWLSKSTSLCLSLWISSSSIILMNLLTNYIKYFHASSTGWHIVLSSECKEEVVTISLAGDILGHLLSNLSLLELQAKLSSTKLNTSVMWSTWGSVTWLASLWLCAWRSEQEPLIAAALLTWASSTTETAGPVSSLL